MIFIVIQSIVISEAVDFSKSKNTILTANIVRKVEADTEEEAIGKFVIATRDIPAKQRLNIECYELNKLSSIK